MPDNSTNNKRIARNTFFLYIRMFLVLIVSLYTSRIVLNALGVEDYGVYNVVAGFVSLFGFLNATLSSSMQRFYNYEGTKQNVDGYRKVYITGLIIHFVIAFILFLLLETFGLWYLNNVMVIPEGRLMAANILYQVSIISMTIVIMGIPYSGYIMAHERMDFYAIVSIIDVILKLIFVAALPFIPRDKLITYAVLSLFITLIDFLLYFTYAKVKFKELNFKWEYNKILFRNILSFSGWNLVGTFAFMLKGQGLNLLLNFFFGPIINAARGVAYQVNGAISGFSSNITVAFRPQLVNSYADGNYDRTRKMMFIESKVCFALILFLMIPVIIEINYILHLWLGNVVPDNTNIFSTLVLIDSLICTLNTPLTQVVWAVGSIKKYQIANSIINLALIPVCYLFLKIGLNATATFVITIVFSCINQIICIIFANKLFHFGLMEYIKKVLIPCLCLVILLPLLPYFASLLMPSSFKRVIVVYLMELVAAFPISYFLVFNQTEKKFAKNIIITKLLKKRK